jgi:hypothetical protein
METYGKNMGKPWEKYGKTVGKSDILAFDIYLYSYTMWFMVFRVAFYRL